MRFEKVYIESLAYHLPENIVTSAEIEKRLAPLYDRLKLPQGRLELMSVFRNAVSGRREFYPVRWQLLPEKKLLPGQGWTRIK
jgi:hypothetical protein